VAAVSKSLAAVFVLVSSLSLILAGCVSNPAAYPTPSPQLSQQDTQLLSFSSWNDVNDFLQASQARGSYGQGVYATREMGAPVPMMAKADSAGGATDYSTTNVQVEGVDEADVMKNDGEFLYVIAENKVKILKAYPASEMKIVSEISFDSNANANGRQTAVPSQIFVYGGKLVVFGSEQAFWEPRPLPEPTIVPTATPTTGPAGKCLDDGNEYSIGDSWGDGCTVCVCEKMNGKAVVNCALPIACPEPTANATPVACTADAKLCPDGSYVGRVSPSCEFTPCPELKAAPVEPGSGSAPSIDREQLDKMMAYPYPYYQQASFVKVYDITSRENPVLVKSFVLSGSYVQSRLIDGRVFVVASDSAYYGGPMPLYAKDGAMRQLLPTDVNYFDYPDYNYNFVTVLGFNLNDLGEQEAKRVVLMGYAQTLFVSKENMFITQTVYDYTPYPTLKWSDYWPILEPYATQDLKDKIAAVDVSDASEWRKEALKVAAGQKFIERLDENVRDDIYGKISGATQNLQAEMEKALRPEFIGGQAKTVIHKFSLGKEISYLGKGSVAGTVLNQYSMDEYNGYFRLATTTEPVYSGVRTLMAEAQNPALQQSSSVFVLNDKLETVGKLAGLAPGERIYSARFMGNRLYLVTFKQVDPLFAIDLSDPANPRVLGQLKIPGYSDYLHPYDETHLIGLGKETEDIKEGNQDLVFPKGVKLSLFDVSDVSTPKELATYVIGDAGSSSYASQDPHAFLFAKNKDGLLVIPVLEAKVNAAKYPGGVPPHTYGDYVFQGAYVFNVDLAKGFTLKGTVSHATPEELAKSGYYWGGTDVQRSAYIENVLYTVSNRFVKASDLATLNALASVEIATEQVYPYG